MRVLFLTHSNDTPSTRWRIHAFLPHLRGHGIEAEVVEFPDGPISQMRAVRRAAEFDTTLLQKRLPSLPLLHLLRRSAKRLLYDFCDAIIYRKHAAGFEPSPTRESRFRWIAREADGVIAANSYLAGLACERGGGNRVTVFPNVVDLARWTPDPRPVRDPDHVVIGWMGSASNLEYLRLVEGPLQRWVARHPHVRVRVVSSETWKTAEPPVEFVPWSEAGEVRQVHLFDIGIAPMADDAWTRGKATIKVLTYFASYVPTVASACGVHADYIRDGENGLLASTEEEWEEALEALVNDSGLRRRMGEAGRRTVEERYALEPAAARLAEILLG